MVVTLFCPNLRCRSILQVPDSTRGKKVRCGQCGTTFVVPDREAAPAASAPPGKEPPAEQQDAAS